MTRSKNRRTIALLSLILLFAALGTIGWLVAPGDSPIFSSPTEERRGGYDVFFTSKDMPATDLRRFQLSLPLELAREIPISKESHADENHEVIVPPGAKVRLAAFALRVPGTDSADRDLRPLDPATKRPSDEQLPAGLLTDSTELRRPRLSLFFEADDALPILHATMGAIFDRRTEFQVSAGSLSEARSGRWTRIDSDLVIWHDTPLKIGLDLLAGEPELSLDGKILDDDLVTPYVGSDESGNWTWFELPEVSIRIRRDTALSMFEARLPESFVGRRNHFGVIVDPRSESPEIHWFRGRLLNFRGQDDRRLLFPAKIGSQLGAVFLAEECRVWFQLPALPGMPGKSDLENLMDVPIPEITIDVGQDYQIDFKAGRNSGTPMENGLIRAAADAAEVEVIQGIVLGQGILQPLREEPEVFHDVTPWQLLEIYRRRSRQSFQFEIDAQHQLVIRVAEPTALQKIRDWWAENAPDWLQF